MRGRPWAVLKRVRKVPTPQAIDCTPANACLGSASAVLFGQWHPMQASRRGLRDLSLGSWALHAQTDSRKLLLRARSSAGSIEKHRAWRSPSERGPYAARRGHRWGRLWGASRGVAGFPNGTECLRQCCPVASTECLRLKARRQIPGRTVRPRRGSARAHSRRAHQRCQPAGST